MLTNNQVVKSWIKRGQSLPQTKFLLLTEADDQIKPRFTSKQAYGETIEQLYSEGINITAVYDLEEEYVSIEEQLSTEKPWFTGQIQNGGKTMGVINKMLDDLAKHGGKAAESATNVGGNLLSQLFQNMEQITITDPKEALAALGISKKDIAEMIGIEPSTLCNMHRVMHDSFDGKEYVFTDGDLAKSYAQLIGEQTGNTPDVLTSLAVKINGYYHLIQPDPLIAQEAVDYIANFTNEKIAKYGVESRRKAALDKLSNEDKAILGLST